MKFAVLTHCSSLFDLVRDCFSDETIECVWFKTDLTLSRAVYRDEYHAIIVDAATGVDAHRAVFARRACYGDRSAPLIVMGAFDGRHGFEQAFEVGADDVVRFPVDRHELAARTHLALRRNQSGTPQRQDDCIEYGQYRLDRRAGTVLIGDEKIRVTVRESAIAWLLFSHAGEYVSRRTIAGAIWSSAREVVGRTIEQHIYNLRKKLRLNGSHGVQLSTMYAYGYRIEMSEPDTATDAGALAESTGSAESAVEPAASAESAGFALADSLASAPQHGHAVHAASSARARVAVQLPMGGWPPSLYSPTWHDGLHSPARLTVNAVVSERAADAEVAPSKTVRRLRLVRSR